MIIKIHARTVDHVTSTWNMSTIIEVPDSYDSHETNLMAKKAIKELWQEKGFSIAEYAWERE